MQKAEELDYKLKAMERMNKNRKKSSIVSSGYDTLSFFKISQKPASSLFVALAFLLERYESKDFED